VQLLDIVIPVYDSEKTIRAIFKELISLDHNFILRVRVILANDGSRDSTLSIAIDRAMRSLQQEVRFSPILSVANLGLISRLSV
jgi:glycosyltransferase involved in cell wall biosynthesis